MEHQAIIPKSIDEYILQYPQEIQEIVKTIRKVIKESVPNAEEKISYGMPTFVLHGNLVHFAAFKNHIGFYPTPSGINKFKQELSGYKTSKAAVQFPIGKPIPYELISKIVKFRVDENKNKAEGKIKKKK
ncbi:iron chaperone [Bacillus sp. JJ1562]|uniref:iron chaperone n=1 Tax=Bacillus sp. JJ1562 TaxID=3122960 RepID=UPI003002B9A3